MSKALVLFSTLIFCNFVRAQVSGCDQDSRAAIEESQQRYKDFFQRQKEVEGVQSEIDSGIPEVKSLREKDRQEQAAALDYQLKTRKREIEDPRLEQEWLAQQKAEKEELEVARRRFVINRDCARKIEAQKVKIPENQEYGIDTDWGTPN